MNVKKAQIRDLAAIIAIDMETIGTDRRKEEIQDAIEKENCIVAKVNDHVVGFLIYHTTFFDCAFISLVIVPANERRKGYASSLLHEMVRTSPTRKVFSSTNQSNQSMQEVFKANGFIESGIVENLDEGDPEIIYYKSI